jgi:hypothetical protein
MTHTPERPWFRLTVWTLSVVVTVFAFRLGSNLHKVYERAQMAGSIEGVDLAAGLNLTMPEF